MIELMHMTIKTLKFGLTVMLLAIATPAIAAGGLVPCDGPDCDLSDLIRMGNNIIKFLVYIGVFIGVVMIAWGGFNLVLSQGNESAMEKAKSRIWNVVIGLLIVLLSYLIVETVLNVLTGDGFDTWGI
jgi:Trk-type K+ transport system membrane component